MNKKPIVYSCSGCSSAAQMTNWIAVRMDREGIAEMSCISGVGGGVKPLVQKARDAESIVVLDGCPLRCAEACLQREGLKPTHHFELSRFAVEKKYHRDFDAREAEDVYRRIVKLIRGFL